MRFVGLFIVIAMIPALVYWLKNYPKQRKWAYFGLGILPFTIGLLNLDAALISWKMWPGYSKGCIITAMDSLAIAIVIVSRKPFARLTLSLAFGAYILAALISVTFSSSITSSFFYIFQLLRIFIVFAAVANIVTQRDGLRYLALGLAVGALVQAGLAIDQRLSGAAQASGSMGHQNLLGMMLHYVTLPLLAMLLAGMRSAVIYAGVGAALLAVALGASRGAIGFVAIGIGMVFLLSFARGITTRKWQIAGFGALALAVTGPLMYESLERRFEIKGEVDTGEYDERAAFETAAIMMWNDNPMGVGANQYVVSANAMGYNNEAGITWAPLSRSTNVHHLYLLVGAETGYLGLGALVFLFGSALFVGYRYTLVMRDDPRGDVVLGFTVAITVTAIHSLWEWIFVVEQMQYMFAIALGVIAGYTRDLSVRKKTSSKTAGPMQMRSAGLTRS